MLAGRPVGTLGIVEQMASIRSGVSDLLRAFWLQVSIANEVQREIG